MGFFCMNSVRYTFMNWTVQYMADFQGQSIKGRAFTAIAIPLIGSLGAVAAGWASDHVFGRRRAPVCAIMLFGLAGVCAVFVAIRRSWILATAMLGLAGFLIYGPDMLMSGAATIDLSHPRAASIATGLTNEPGGHGRHLLRRGHRPSQRLRTGRLVARVLGARGALGGVGPAHGLDLERTTPGAK
jgi:OPA family sugar phosphate sensor protein UhpC-like MFS transporter